MAGSSPTHRLPSDILEPLRTTPVGGHSSLFGPKCNQRKERGGISLKIKKTLVSPARCAPSRVATRDYLKIKRFFRTTCVERVLSYFTGINKRGMGWRSYVTF